MFLKIWNFLRGYVKIGLSGFSVERFINMAAYRGVYFWDVRPEGGEITLKCSIAAFRQLRPHGKKTRVRFRVLGRYGLPFVLHRYRARKLLAAGVLLFAAGLYFLASFIWLVEISGNDRLENSQILEFLEENGLGIGAFRGTINYRDMEIALLAHFPADIAFASVSIRGTRAMIDIYETIQPPEIIDTSIPADIIAAKDGLIISIATSAGTPQVRPGDVVAAGDVLVAGELRIAASDYDETLYHSEYVRAASRVLARMYYTLVLEVPLDIVERVFTGNIVRNRAIIISERNFNIWRPRANFTESDIITKETQLILGRNYPMPFWLITTEYREYELVRRRRSLDEAMHFAYEQLTARILADFAEAEIIRQELEFFEGNNSVHIEVFLVTIERIDEVKEIDVLAED